jgi:hypothetical protein
MPSAPASGSVCASRAADWRAVGRSISAHSTAVRRHAVMGLIVSAVALHAALLAFVPHLFQRWPFAMYFGYTDKHVLAHGWPTVLPTLFSLAFLILIVSRFWTRPRLFVVLLFLCAVALQMSWSLLDGVAAARISSTLLSKHYGHSEFVELAHDSAGPWRVAREYEHLAASDPRFVYAKSKPPGQLLFYTLSVRLFELLPLEALSQRAVKMMGFFADSPYASFGPFATLLFVSLSCSPVFILYRLGTLLVDHTVGACLCLSFVLMPALNLVTMHMDQVLYPLIVTGALYTLVLGVHRNPTYAVLAGVVTYAGIYVSFSLLFLFPTISLLLLGYGAFCHPRRHRAVVAGVLFGLTAVASAVVFYFVLHFDPLPAYLRASAHHRAWTDIQGLIKFRGNVHNFYEFAVWIGLPTVCLYVSQCWRIVSNPGANRTPAAVFALGYPLVLLTMSVFGGTVYEIGRLWIPFTVPALLPVARELASLQAGQRPLLFAVAGFVAILLMKNYQDFQ